MSREKLTVLLVAASMVGGAACEKAERGFNRVQRAVGEGAQGALSARPVLSAEAPREGQAIPEARADDALPADRVPAPLVALDGSARFTPDANHRDITSVRTTRGWAVGWTDGARRVMYTGMVDPDGRPGAHSTAVHVAVEGEEGVEAPSMVASNDGLAVAWVDRENGRVRFARLDGRGALRGRVSIVHDGVTAPRATRLVFNGREFGVAVAMRAGVYFARVAADGARLGDGVVLHEGNAVSSIDNLAWDGRGYDLSFTVQADGRMEQVRQRVSARAERRGELSVTTA